MKSLAQYIIESKEAGRCKSDRELGELIGFSQQTIADAKAGRASDVVALALGELLVKHKRLSHAGEVILVAHAERKIDARVKSVLLDYAKKVLATVPARIASAVAGLGLSLALSLPSGNAQAQAGGAGGIRT